MCEDNIEIGVTEITNNILVSATPTDQIIDINVLETTENVELTITPSVVEVNIDVTQELITEVVTIDANTCVNIIDVSVTDATENVVLNITPSLVEVNINRGQNNLSIEEYATFADLPTIGDVNTYYITLDENKFWRWDTISGTYIEISDSNDRIPYLGAIKNSDLGEWGIKSNWFGLDTTPTNPPTSVGTFTWNDIDGTADLKLKGGNVTLQIGQESVVRVVNKTGATLNEADFRAVRVRSVAEGGAQGQRLAVLLAQADSDADSATTIGLVTESIANNQEGFITISGNVNDINTTGAKSWAGSETWVDGDMLYVSPTHSGYLTNIKPVAPQHMVVVGYVVYAHANHGKIFVKVDNGYELDELHNVLISSATNKDTLVYNSTSGIWENKPLSYLLSATAPLNLTSGVLSITQANATTNGYLSSTDWNYFSAKQQALSGTGFVKISGSTISYDNTVYTPQGRTLTINGTSYDLSADRSWSISVGSGMRNVSSFVATAGQTTFTIVGGYTAGLVDVYVNGARLNASDYTATNGTTVVLGTGLVANDIVDIINYTASLTSGITGSGTTNYIPKWSSSSNLTNSLLFDDGTNVGLNTITPDTLFQVFYNSGASTTYTDIVHIGSNAGRSLFLGTSGYGFSLNDSANGAGWGIRTDWDSGFMRFHYGNSEKARLLSNGNFGLGLTNPAYKLDVVGDVNITGAFRINGVAIGGGSGTVTGTGTSGYLAKWTGTTAINGSLIYDNGTNIGIGTASPSYAFHVYNTTSSARLAIEGTTNFVTTQHTNSSGSFYLGIDDSAGANFTGTGYGRFLYSAGAYPMVFITNAAERMRITSAGQILVGTTSNAFGSGWNGITLGATTGFADGYGNTRLYNNAYHNGSNNVYMTTGAANLYTSVGGAHIWYNAPSGTGGTAASFTERMRITSIGDVLMGKSAENAAVSGFQYRGAAPGLVQITRDGGEALQLWRYTSNGKMLVFYYNGTEVGSISSNTSSLPSDLNFKKDISDIKLGLDFVNKLRPVHYRHKLDSNNEPLSNGIIAQEMEQALLDSGITKNELLMLQHKNNSNPNESNYWVDYTKLIPVLIQSIKELNAKLEAK